MEATASDAKRIESIQPLPGNVADLKKVFEGQIAEPGTTEYEQSRVAWNKDSLGWPSAIATVASEKDVVSVVNYARENNCNLCIGMFLLLLPSVCLFKTACLTLCWCSIRKQLKL